MILFGVVMYITAKKYGYLDRYIRLKYLLEFHIFLCTLGPILVLFHTTFKFGGIVSVAFWSMTAIVLSGVVGRYLYLQIPKSVSGRTKSLQEIETDVDASEAGMRRIKTMYKWFGYWHIVHRPFALIMLVIVVIHIGVTLALGYKWIF